MYDVIWFTDEYESWAIQNVRRLSDLEIMLRKLEAMQGLVVNPDQAPMIDRYGYRVGRCSVMTANRYGVRAFAAGKVEDHAPARTYSVPILREPDPESELESESEEYGDERDGELEIVGYVDKIIPAEHQRSGTYLKQFGWFKDVHVEAEGKCVAANFRPEVFESVEWKKAETEHKSADAARLAALSIQRLSAWEIRVWKLAGLLKAGIVGPCTMALTLLSWAISAFATILIDLPAFAMAWPARMIRQSAERNRKLRPLTPLQRAREGLALVQSGRPMGGA